MDTMIRLFICMPVFIFTGENGKPQLGHRKMVKGEQSFFLQPGEQLEKGIQDVYILGEEEGIVLRSLAEYEDTQANPPVHRKPGDTWMLKGPMEYIPTVEVEVVTTRHAIPLHENEGIYVRNIKSGAVRSVIGHTYMLKVSPSNVKNQLVYLNLSMIYINIRP